MTIQRKHFELIAQTIKEFDQFSHAFPLGIAENIQADVAKRFASKLKLTNPQFDRARFLKACGVED